MSPHSSIDRAALWQRVRERREPWDLIVIGGGATGVGIALDAAARGYETALFEQHDFGKGTSSRSTKLIHGGVRYLQQGNITLVRDALLERGRLLANAPHLVYPLPTIVPCYRWHERMYYGLGLKAYDFLAGKLGIQPSRQLSRNATIAELPTIRREHLRGGVKYFDAGFDDARLLITLMQAAVQGGAVCLNYAKVGQLTRTTGRIDGVVVDDVESGESFRVAAKAVINATGPFSDEVRRLDDPEDETRIAPSQGVHLVLDRKFLPGDAALIVPKTSDGRVVFAIPWQGRTVVGTTDTPGVKTSLEPQARCDEAEYLLATIAAYLDAAPTTSDVLGVFAGIRPLVGSGRAEKTSTLGRDHVIRVSDSGLISIMGGKWTTYRKMAEDAVARAIETAGLAAAPCRTENLSLVGGDEGVLEDELWKPYGAAGAGVKALCESSPELSQSLDDALPYLRGQVVWAVRHESARTVEDVLARRLRALFLDVQAALRSAPIAAELAAAELGHARPWIDQQIEAFRDVAKHYQIETIL